MLRCETRWYPGNLMCLSEQVLSVWWHSFHNRTEVTWMSFIFCPRLTVAGWFIPMSIKHIPDKRVTSRRILSSRAKRTPVWWQELCSFFQFHQRLKDNWTEKQLLLHLCGRDCDSFQRDALCKEACSQQGQNSLSPPEIWSEDLNRLTRFFYLNILFSNPSHGFKRPWWNGIIMATESLLLVLWLWITWFN